MTLESCELFACWWCATQQLQRGTGDAPGVQGRNVVLESKYGSPRIVNDGVTVAKEVELEDPVENIGAKLVRQARTSRCIVCCYSRTRAARLSALVACSMMVPLPLVPS